MVARVVLSRVTWMLRLELERPTALLACTHGAKLKANNGGGASSCPTKGKAQPTKIKTYLVNQSSRVRWHARKRSEETRLIDGTEFVRISEEIASEMSSALLCTSYLVSHGDGLTVCHCQVIIDEAKIKHLGLVCLTN